MIHLNNAHKNTPCNNFEEREFGSRSDYIIVDGNTLSFQIQNGPIGDVGVNGIQVTDVLAFTKELYKSLNAAFPCRENSLTITKIEEALHWQEARTRDKVNRNVEGTNND